MWEEFLQRLAAANPAFTYDNICDGDLKDFDGLTKLGLLHEIELAQRVVCDACSEAHSERVQWSNDGNQAWIPCPSAGIVEVNPERLRRWRIDVTVLARIVADGLELTQSPRALQAIGHLWNLGRRRFVGRFRDVFFSAAPYEKYREVVEAIQEQLPSGTGLLITCADTPANSGWEPSRLKTITFADIASWNSGKITLDLFFIEEIWAPNIGETKAPNIPSIPFPDDTQWQDVLIEVADGTIAIGVRGYQKTLSITQAGFSERDQRLDTLRLLAASRGQLAPERVSKVLKGDTPLKNRMNTLRRLLQTLIPIDGNPIEHNRRAGIYQSNFQVRLSSDVSFPTPTVATWLDFRFVERRDGRLAVVVNEKTVFRAHARAPESDRPNEEVAQRLEPVSRIYSLDEIGLRDNHGRLSREGEMLVELLRHGGQLKREGDDLAVLKLAKWLRNWTGLQNEPLLYSDRTRSWTACFECHSDLER